MNAIHASLVFWAQIDNRFWLRPDNPSSSACNVMTLLLFQLYSVSLLSSLESFREGDRTRACFGSANFATGQDQLELSTDLFIDAYIILLSSQYLCSVLFRVSNSCYGETHRRWREYYALACQYAFFRSKSAWEIPAMVPLWANERTIWHEKESKE